MIGVLLMAYGTPDNPGQVEPYFTHIRGGRTPSAESVRQLQRRYEIVGGRTPLLEITKRLARSLEKSLNASGESQQYRVDVGMKHWHPYIGDVLPRMVSGGVRDLVAVVLAPHYSRMSVGGYRAALDAAIAALPAPPPLTFVESWHAHPGFADLWARRVRAALATWPPAARGEIVTVFSAHSLPERIREWNDPYEAQLLTSCHAVAERAGIDHWRFAFQSAGETGEPWLGPDILDVLQRLSSDGVRDVLSVPLGFVSDHLEVQYDIDHAAARKAEETGITLRRVSMPNDDPAFVQLLAAIVTDAVAPSELVR